MEYWIRNIAPLVVLVSIAWYQIGKWRLGESYPNLREFGDNALEKSKQGDEDAHNDLVGVICLMAVYLGPISWVGGVKGSLRWIWRKLKG